MPGRIATVSGTMLVPGVSRNGRLYTPELIASAVKRMQERIADPDGLPITVRTHHDAGDDSSRIIGRIANVTVEKDGSASYSADLYDTTHGRDIASLVTGKKPALKSVSIHGYWIGQVKRLTYEGQSVTTADDLEVDSVDFTGTPGVLGAKIASAAYLPQDGPAESTGRIAISESAEAMVEAVIDEAAVEEYSAKQRRQMLAAGQAMKNASGEPSYTIKTKADLRRAIKAVGRGGADHDKIRAFIIRRAAALGLSNMIPPNWNKDGSMKENATRYSDVREYYPDGPAGGAGFCIDAYNGPLCITLRAACLDPAELRAVTAAAMSAAVDALQAMDPDMDADIDVQGAPVADTDDDMDSTESAPLPVAGQQPTREHIAAVQAATDAGHLTPAAVTEALALTQTTEPTPGAATTITEEEAAMGEPTTETATTAAPARSLTDADLTALAGVFGAALKESMAPVLTAATESKPGKKDKVTESAPADAEPKPDKALRKQLKETLQAELADIKESLRAELLPQVRDELRAELLRENGLPARQGYRVHENDKPEPSVEDLFANRADLLLGDYAKVPQPAQ